jgi:hypothetical protein
MKTNDIMEAQKFIIFDVGSWNEMRSVFIQYFACIQHCELCGTDGSGCFLSMNKNYEVGRFTAPQGAQTMASNLLLREGTIKLPC